MSSGGRARCSRVRTPSGDPVNQLLLNPTNGRHCCHFPGIQVHLTGLLLSALKRGLFSRHHPVTLRVHIGLRAKAQTVAAQRSSRHVGTFYPERHKMCSREELCLQGLTKQMVLQGCRVAFRALRLPGPSGAVNECRFMGLGSWDLSSGVRSSSPRHDGVGERGSE